MSPSGELYILGASDSRLRKVDTNGIISSVAGDGTSAYGGDGGPAISAKLNGPYSVVVSPAGDVYIADMSNNRIRKIDTNGIITTFAGTGVGSHGGNGGPASSAQIRFPYAITLASTGEMYIADTGNQRIRKIDTNGIISTIAGDGNGRHAGDGGPATLASLYSPRGITVSNTGEIYISDANNQRIRKIDTNGIISTITGTGAGAYGGDGGDPRSASINAPYGLALSGQYLYFADSENSRIRRIALPTITCNGILINYPLVCSGNGQCIDTDVCVCKSGWKEGSDCSVPLTCFGNFANTSLSCNGKGKCIGDNTCECGEGWTGDNCDIPICFGKLGNDTLNVCSGRGQCKSNNTCLCNTDWTGTMCEIPICFGKLSNDTLNVCSGHGQCVSDNTCQCNNDWTGSKCEIPICFGKLSNDTVSVCSGHGQCISNNTCQCSTDWTGSKCEIPICFGKLGTDTMNVCSGHGQCVYNNTCQCNNDWSGSKCEIPICFGKLSNDSLNVCSGHGQCISNNTCQCSTDWTGSKCEIPICFGKIGTDTMNVCSGRGQCVSDNTCQCSTGWSGSKCELPICFGKLSNDTVSVCSGHGQCISNNTCQCSTGWSGESCSIVTCFTIPKTDSNVCSSRGSCIGIDTCQCRDGWTGSKCEQFQCFGLLPNSVAVCNNGKGSCISNNTCSCLNNGWIGDRCEIATCFNIASNDPLVCSGHGSCIGIDECTCSSGWNGKKCSCSPQFTCSSHGECNVNETCNCFANSTIGFWRNETCNQCQESYFGKNCWTSLKSDIRLMDDFSGITFTLYGNLQSDQSINCSQIIPYSEMYLFGSNPTCNWIYSSSQFNIKFGEGSLITSNSLIHLNMLVFDSEINMNNVNVSDIVPSTILEPLNPIKPITSNQNFNPKLEYLAFLSLLLLVIIVVIVVVLIVWCVIKNKKKQVPTTHIASKELAYVI